MGGGGKVASEAHILSAVDLKVICFIYIKKAEDQVSLGSVIDLRGLHGGRIYSSDVFMTLLGGGRQSY